jgi:hypothetical protein
MGNTYYNSVVKKVQLPENVERKNDLAASLRKLADLVGESFCLQHDLARMASYDGKTHRGVLKRPNRKQLLIAVENNEVLHQVPSLSNIDRLCPLLAKDNPLSLIVTFNDALYKGLITFDDIIEKLEGGRFVGKPMLRDILPYLHDDLESIFETCFDLKRELLGLQPIGAQLEIENCRADFHYKHFLFELDGMEKFSGKFDRTTKEQVKHELHKGNIYLMHDYLCFRIVWEELHNGELEKYLSWAKIPKQRNKHGLERMIRRYLRRTERAKAREFEKKRQK